MVSCTREAECPFGVVGVEVTIENGLPVVLSSVDGTPAARAGVMARDIVAEVDGEPTQGLTLHEIADRFAGPAGAPIRLKLMRPGQDKPIALTLTREARPVRSVEARVEGGDIGYLRIAAFNDETSGALRKAIAEISAKVPPEQLKGYVLDLRNNPGGLLDSALSVANEFLASGEIVDIRGREMKEIKRYDASGRGPHSRQACGRADQRRLGGRRRDPRRGAAGQQARDDRRHAFVRRGGGDEHDRARQGGRRVAADDRSLFHARRPSHQRQRHRAGHRGAAGCARGAQ